MFAHEKKYTNLTAFSKYSKASAYFSYFSSAWPTLLKSLAFLVFTFNADLKMLYSDSLKKTAKNVKQDYQRDLAAGETCIICEIYLQVSFFEKLKFSITSNDKYNQGF